MPPRKLAEVNYLYSFIKNESNFTDFYLPTNVNILIRKVCHRLHHRCLPLPHRRHPLHHLHLPLRFCHFQ